MDLQHAQWYNVNETPDNICLFKVNNRNTRKRCDISSKLEIKTTERHRRFTHPLKTLENDVFREYELVSFRCFYR